MAMGWKPAAYFCDSADFDPADAEESLWALAESGIVERYIRLRPNLSVMRFYHVFREAIYVLPGHVTLVGILRQLSADWNQHRPDVGYATEFAFAKAPGYGETDIRTFIWRTYAG